MERVAVDGIGIDFLIGRVHNDKVIFSEIIPNNIIRNISDKIFLMDS
jgi:hypothetical protein